MNSSSSAKKDPDAIRSDIDETRRRMDDTMDELGERFQPRHLLDEALGFLRGNSSDGENRLTHMREKFSHSCDTALHTVTDTVKKHPLPTLLVGAGVAWMIYEARRRKSAGRYNPDLYDDDPEFGTRYDPDVHYERPLDYPSASSGSESPDDPTFGATPPWGSESAFKPENAGNKIADKASAVAGQLKDKLSHAGEVAREKVGAWRDRASEVTSQVKDSTRHAYERTRDRVATGVDEHPLEIGLAVLAGGLIAGLLLPTPQLVNRRLGPTADRLRTRTREAGEEMLQKGKRVAQAAVRAAQNEAQVQELTPEALREKTAAVAGRAKEAGEETARREGLAGGAEGNQAGSQQNDPSIARPVA